MLFWIVVVALFTSSTTAEQHPLGLGNDAFGDGAQHRYYKFPHDIKRVAVIGAGPSGLQAASALLDEGLEVRLFERQDQPGGNWYYQDAQPIELSPRKHRSLYKSFNNPTHKIPSVQYYNDGAEGVSNSWRIREHTNPSPIWNNLTTIIPPFMMTLPNTEYPPTVPWRVPQVHIGRHVRQFASAHSLSPNDEQSAHIISYSTRIEHVHKTPSTGKWTLTLRKLEQLRYNRTTGEPLGPGGEVREEWWTEDFDAIVDAAGPFDGPFVPTSIEGLHDWMEDYPHCIWHSRNYRRPDQFQGKNVLIIGGGLSALGISKDLAEGGALVSVSTRDNAMSPVQQGILPLLHKNVTKLPEIHSFFPLEPTPEPSCDELGELRIMLANGTVLSGYDYIVLATGYRTSHPFLSDYHNSTIKGREEPDVQVAPIITDGTHLRSLHWTGHYINDPTLAIARFTPWTIGRYSSLGFARVWSGRARLPSVEQMWAEYPGAGKELLDPVGFGEWCSRLFITWLNTEALEFGGRFVDSLPRHHYDLAYFGAGEWRNDKFINLKFLLSLEDTPQSQWPTRNGREQEEWMSGDLDRLLNLDVTLGAAEWPSEIPMVNDETWREWNLEW
ncbi:FAD/NAD(P)-binding domain-containing protein [Clavulina sp. PMI_390]|nr:FAD/NAD(P)-binding domain-containing protein [Clavulina sp. PMI_390]